MTHDNHGKQFFIYANCMVAMMGTFKILFHKVRENKKQTNNNNSIIADSLSIAFKAWHLKMLHKKTELNKHTFCCVLC